MAKLKHKFAVDDPAMAGGGGRTLVPEAQYQGMLVTDKYKETSKGGHFIEMELLITHGEHKNKTLVIMLNVDNKNQKTVEIAYKTITRIADACGFTHTPDDTAEFLKIPIMFETKTKKNDDWCNDKGETVKGADESVVAKWLKMPAVGNGMGQTEPETQNTGFSGGGSTAETGGPAVVEKPKGGNPFAQ